MMELRTLLMPFAGFSERPYDQVILKDVDWYSIYPTYWAHSALTLTQRHLNIEGIFGKSYSADPFPRLVRWTDEKLYVEDGHHRLVLSARILLRIGDSCRMLDLSRGFDVLR